MNSSTEVYILEKVRELYRNFPPGIIDHPNKPDFIVIGPKTIGIEITQIFHDSGLKDSQLKRNESIHKLIGVRIAEDIYRHFQVGLLVDIDFSIHHKIRNATHAKLIAKVCTPELTSQLHLLSISNYFRIRNIGQLPIEIDHITISRYDRIERPFFVESAGGAVPNLNTKHLLPILKKKELAIKGYKRCDEYWLIIQEGNFYSDSFDQIELDSVPTTSFNKLLLFRQAENLVIDLK